MLLLPSQMATVFEVVQRSGLDPTSFAWEECESPNLRGDRTSVLRHRPSGYHFRFENQGRGYVGIHSPGEENTIEVLARRLDWCHHLSRDRVRGPGHRDSRPPVVGSFPEPGDARAVGGSEYGLGKVMSPPRAGGARRGAGHPDARRDSQRGTSRPLDPQAGPRLLPHPLRFERLQDTWHPLLEHLSILRGLNTCSRVQPFASC